MCGTVGMWIQCTFPSKIVLETWIFYIFRLEKDEINCAWEFDIIRYTENSTLTLFSKQGDYQLQNFIPISSYQTKPLLSLHFLSFFLPTLSP